MIVNSDMSQVKLFSLVNHEIAIRRQARLAIIASEQSQNRLTELVSLFYSDLSMVSTKLDGQNIFLLNPRRCSPLFQPHSTVRHTAQSINWRPNIKIRFHNLFMK